MEIFGNLLNIFLDAYNKNSLAQSFGIIAYFITLITFIFFKDRKFIIGNLINSFFWGIHYQILGFAVASFINYFDILKNFLALKFERKKYYFYFFILSYLIIGLFTYENIYSLFPVFSVLFSSYLVFFVRGINLKIGFLFVLIGWLFFNIFSMSIGGIFSDTTLIIAGIFGITKDFLEEKKKKNNS